jgi:AraC-like DNA-binding protein
MDENDLLLPSIAIERIGTKEIYSICESLRTNQFEDVLNIQCYEAFVAHFEMLPVIGNPVWIQSVKELIHDDPFAKLSLSYLSQQFNLHPNYIIRKFKKCTGFKLSEYVTKIRLESAMAGMIKKANEAENAFGALIEGLRATVRAMLDSIKPQLDQLKRALGQSSTPTPGTPEATEFWKYFNENIYPMSAEQKASFMNK